MLVNKYYTGNKKSTYRCDRCNTFIDTETDCKYRVAVNSSDKRAKVIASWDLCSNCFKALKRGIRKKKDEVMNNERPE